MALKKGPRKVCKKELQQFGKAKRVCRTIKHKYCVLRGKQVVSCHLKAATANKKAASLRKTSTRKATAVGKKRALRKMKPIRVQKRLL